MEAEQSKHPFFTSIPGPVGGLRVGLDILHTVDLGFAGTLCSSVLNHWTAGRKREEQVADIWNMIREAYDKLRTGDRLNNLNLGTFIHGRPARPGMKTKASETRHLVPAMAIVARRRGVRTAVQRHCAEALEHLARFYVICEGQGMFMEEAAAADAFEQMKQSLQHYAWLHMHFYKLSPESGMFPVRPKFHWCYHIGASTKYMNPRHSWTYRNEDWVGRMSRLALSCAHGTRSIKIMKSFVQKYLCMLNHRLRRPMTTD